MHRYAPARQRGLHGSPRVGYLLTAAAAGTMLLASFPAALVAFALLGLGMGATESLGRAFAAQVAAVADPTMHLGVYHALTGFAGLFGGLAAGLLWDHASPQAAFAWGAAVPLVAVLGLVLMRRRYPHAWRKGPPLLPA